MKRRGFLRNSVFASMIAGLGIPKLNQEITIHKPEDNYEYIYRETRYYEYFTRLNKHDYNDCCTIVYDRYYKKWAISNIVMPFIGWSNKQIPMLLFQAKLKESITSIFVNESISDS